MTFTPSRSDLPKSANDFPPEISDFDKLRKHTKWLCQRIGRKQKAQLYLQ